MTSTYTNGTRPTTAAPFLIETADLRAELDALEDCITDLDRALGTAADARLRLDKLNRELEAIEASILLGIEGGNAEQRKARLVLALGDDDRHVRTVQAIDAERARLLDAERRAQVARERCRLLRASLALAGGTD